MKLAKALKMKNQLAGDVAQLKDLLAKLSTARSHLTIPGNLIRRDNG